MMLLVVLWAEQVEVDMMMSGLKRPIGLYEHFGAERWIEDDAVIIRFYRDQA